MRVNVSRFGVCMHIHLSVLHRTDSDYVSTTAPYMTLDFCKNLLSYPSSLFIRNPSTHFGTIHQVRSIPALNSGLAPNFKFQIYLLDPTEKSANLGTLGLRTWSSYVHRP